MRINNPAPFKALAVILLLAAGSSAVYGLGAKAVDTGSCDGDLVTFYRDADLDGYGLADETVLACTRPDGYAAAAGDCDDTRADVHPGANEVCDLIDNNCSGQNNEGLATTTYYIDDDGDEYGVLATTTVWCAQPDGYAAAAGDCDDTRADVHPGASEACNGRDDDCDGAVDEGLSTSTYYRDADGDGYGQAGSATTTCAAPGGFVANDDDCDDTRASVHPGASEACDGRDNDCDGVTDEGCTAFTYYRDADGDGYGDPGNSTQAATPPSGYVSNDGDCDDTRADVHPGASEACDGRDNDCDGRIDEDMPGCDCGDCPCECKCECKCKSTCPCDCDNDEGGNCHGNGQNNHGAVVSCLSQFTNCLKSNGLLTGREKGQIMKEASEIKKIMKKWPKKGKADRDDDD